MAQHATNSKIIGKTTTEDGQGVKETAPIFREHTCTQTWPVRQVLNVVPGHAMSISKCSLLKCSAIRIAFLCSKTNLSAWWRMPLLQNATIVVCTSLNGETLSWAYTARRSCRHLKWTESTEREWQAIYRNTDGRSGTWFQCATINFSRCKVGQLHHTLYMFQAHLWTHQMYHQDRSKAAKQRMNIALFTLPTYMASKSCPNSSTGRQQAVSTIKK